MANNGHEGFGETAEFPQHAVDLPPYQIGKPELRHGEYRRFVEAGGYRDPSCWSPQGGAWKEGHPIVHAGMYGRTTVIQRPDPDEPRNEPEHWAAEQVRIDHGLAIPVPSRPTSIR